MQRGKGAELTPLSAPLLVWTEAHATDLEDALLAIGLFDDRPHDRFQIESHEAPGCDAVLHARPARHPPAANRERVGGTGRGAPTTTDRPALVPEPSEVDQSRCGATMAPPSAPPQR